MRDIPVFTTENGVASLVLKEIAYKKEAFIQLQDSLEPEKLLDECVQFCVAAGAERVYASGHESLAAYPKHTVIVRMQCLREQLPDTDAALFPVQEKTFARWREIYNERMQGVANAATITMSDADKILREGSAYFVHRGGELLGIGMASGDTVQAVASVVPGAGQDVLAALCCALVTTTVRLEVCDTNAAAMRLYARLGFVTVGELSHWYRVR